MVNSLLLHDRLGHPNTDIVNQVAFSMNKKLTHINTSYLCNLCKLAKAHRLHVTHMHTHSLYPFDIVHIDLWGPISCYFIARNEILSLVC